MLNIIERLFGRKRYELVLLRYFPEGHPRSGQATHFGSKLTSTACPKIHTICTDKKDWSDAAQRINKGRARLYLVYRSIRNMTLYTVEITMLRHLGIQQAVIPPPEQDYILVDEKEIPLADFLKNEGLNEMDFRAWYRNDIGKQITVLHLTEFKY